MSQVLSPLHYPLQGSALIEASAGTGKTYTLAMLYVRFVLQQGGSLAYKQALLPPNILVVTFTRAATKELRERIRQRLVETAMLFRADLTTLKSPDPLLVQLRDAVIQEGLAAGHTDQHTLLMSAAYKLDMAAQWMDEASISTIHGWCYRMLKEHAFDSGNLFQQELIESETDLLQQAAEDYWRHFYMHLPSEELEHVLSFFHSPRDTHKQVLNLLEQRHLLSKPTQAPAELIAATKQQKEAVLTPLKEAWRSQYLPALQAAFEQANKAKAYKATSLNKRHIGGVVDKLLEWTANEEDAPDLDFDKSASFKRLALLDTSIWTDETAIPWANEGCKALAELPQQLASLPCPLSDLLSHATHWIAARLALLKKQQSMISNQDLLDALDKALHSERGERLAAAIREQFPVALVDEFQDTDPVQYRIFNRIYNIAESSPDHAFFMIGDPKQAIYAFRGADIYTYLEAKKATAGRHYTLDHNYRSAPALIQSVNTLFAQADKHDQGAFLFKQGNENPIPFVQVKPGKSNHLWLELDGTPYAPMLAWVMPAADEGTLTKGAFEETISEATATEITKLLIAAQEKRAWLVEACPEGEVKERQQLAPADIAVLVNNRGEADKVRQALQDKGVASVYLSEKNSVFQSDAATLLLHLLRAVAEPYNDTLLRKALSLPALGLDLQQLDALNRDELVWERRVQQFVQYHWDWQQKGSLAVVHLFIKDFKLAERLLQQPGGERQMSDLLHLAELLQKASAELDGEQALIRYLQEQQESPDENNEAQQLRLESDSQLVQVVTVHKSKGLEYPLVFLPFATHCRVTKKNDVPLKVHNEAGELSLYLQATPERLKQADHERLAEDIRKLYVALTRASHCQWVGIGAYKDYDLSAMGYLLNVAKTNNLEKQVTQAGFTLAEPTSSDLVFEKVISTTFKPVELPQLGNLTNWWIASYSAIQFESVAESSQLPMATNTATPDRDTSSPRDEQREEEVKVGAVEPELIPQPLATNTQPLSKLNVMHHFPAGATWGTLLHTLLEWAAVQEFRQEDTLVTKGFAAIVAENEKSKANFFTFCQRRHIDEYAEALWGWLLDFVQIEWSLASEQHSDSLRLSALSPEQVAVELEFMLESHQVSTQSLDQLVRRHTLNQVARPVAQANSLNGLLKGFIDLVAEHNGRYYVIDWKSNRLGNNDLDYTQEAMLQQVLMHRYDMQYVLYLVALHRLLKARLPNYNYDTHVGGAVYVFLRGMHGHLTSGLFYDKPPKQLIEQLDALLQGTAL
ncbi:exodeoxyribonuclease V subunit beta [Aliidiomarina taiwanensis]|uniref:RecBCD enzyme subunit RecB n=1 Tax=Aliidiomarina taiwanensis TaxID=946228 RepID=A0A432X9C4_9GAMM|nr:exodeoxyribonuclease V subunit beta [Aliidiomarina taiwanensis]RUO43959.1 exodeoxyribonuclease V subunit beta [Aliidiomarina taiwanensis]